MQISLNCGIAGITFIAVCIIIILVQAKELQRKNNCVDCDQYRKEKGLFVQLESLVWWFKRNWSAFIVYISATSLIGLFLATVIFSETITLVTMNNWVSLILGFTALFMSIVSMVLSFYNVEQSHNSEKRMMQTNLDIGHKLELLDELKNLLKDDLDTTKQVQQEINNIKKETLNYRPGEDEGKRADNNWIENDPSEGIKSDIRIKELEDDSYEVH